VNMCCNGGGMGLERSRLMSLAWISLLHRLRRRSLAQDFGGIRLTGWELPE
jgi:hypothetical protein